MNCLTQHKSILSRFPKFELSYETVSHKKVSSTNTIAIAISLGRKYFIWFTYKNGGADNACYLIGLDKEKQISSIEEICFEHTDKRISLGTIVFGTLYEHHMDSNSLQIFLVEDVYYHCGVNLSNLCFGERIGFLREFIETITLPVSRGNHPFPTFQINSEKIAVALSLMWHVESGKEYSHIIPENLFGLNIAYVSHHIQYREIDRVAPYINVAIPKRGTIPSSIVEKVSSAKIAQKMTATAIMNPIPHFDLSKSTYRYPAVFNLTADVQLDLYHLYAYGGKDVAIYCGLAGIQSLKTSMFMNKIFRRIRENSNLDLAEESEDDEEFENADANKYVNLEAVVPMECVFNAKHRKWMPVKLAGKHERVIHIDKLIADNSTSHVDKMNRHKKTSTYIPPRQFRNKHRKM